MENKTGITSLLFNVSLCLIAAAILFCCLGKSSGSINKIEGEAQGTTYQITYVSENLISKKSIDSILHAIDLSLSTYVRGSLISKINNNDTTVQVDNIFTTVFNKANEVSENTDGAFDVTVGPVINAYGFGFQKRARIDSVSIDSLLNFVGFKKVKLLNNKLIKESPHVLIDFNGIAQGYTVDVLAEFLEHNDVKNYLIELGGEVKASGTKDGRPWRIGIDKPNEHETTDRLLQAIIVVNDKAVATSGNYRRYYVENGRKYAHIIDPSTGFPARHSLLSATVVANDCITADAYATAFMVMGLETTKDFIQRNAELNLEVYLIYADGDQWKTYTSETLKENIEGSI